MPDSMSLDRPGPALQAAVPSGDRSTPWQATCDAFSADYLEARSSGMSEDAVNDNETSTAND